MDNEKNKNRASHNKYYGQTGENEACRYLIESGYTILERNFKCKAGEIDIIAMERDILVFVEVKTRKDKRNGRAALAVGPKKLHRILLTMIYYLNGNKWLKKYNKRIDIIEIYLTDGWNRETDGLGTMEINHIKNIEVREAEKYAI